MDNSTLKGDWTLVEREVGVSRAQGVQAYQVGFKVTQSRKSSSSIEVPMFPILTFVYKIKVDSFLLILRVFPFGYISLSLGPP